MTSARIGIYGFLVIVASASAQTTPPPDLAKRVAEREAATEAERSRYLYRQKMRVTEVDARGIYEETREVIFLPDGRREERLSGRPVQLLKRLVLTEEDFSDLRDIQPLLLTQDTLPAYQIRQRGEEVVDGVACWVLEVKPRQVFQGMRYFDGLLFVEKESFSVIRSEGQAVPPIYKDGHENLFPRFVTLRKKVDGQFWFPAFTWADDTLPFKSGPLRMRLEIRYENYRRFGADSTITFEGPKPPRQ